MATDYPTSLDSFTDKTDNVDNVMAADINDVQDAVEALEAKLGIDGSADTDSIDYKVNNFFTTGRTLLLYEDSAPTGWTIQNTLDDKLVYVTKGSGAGGQTGGTVHSSGTWTIGGLSDSGHTHGVGSYATQAHNHQWYDSTAWDLDDKTYNSSGSNVVFPVATSKGYDLYALELFHTAGISGPGDCYTSNSSPGLSGNSASGTASINSNGSWRPAAYCCIMVTKN